MASSKTPESSDPARLAVPAALDELFEEMLRATDLLWACHRMVDGVRAALNCDKVAVSVRRGCRERYVLGALSGVASFDRRAEATEALADVLRECISSKEGSTRWLRDEASGTVSGAQAGLAKAFRAERVQAIALAEPKMEVAGAIVMVWKAGTAPSEEDLDALRQILPRMASLFRILRSAEMSAGARLVKTVLGASEKRGIRLGAVVLLALLVLLPVFQGTVRSACTLRPVVRRIVSAPFDGLLSYVQVRTGDAVQGGEMLALLDDSELRMELAAQDADMHRAEKTSDVNLVSGDIAAAQIATHEAERINERINLLKNRLEASTIRSPIKGVVLRNSTNDEAGAPVRAGQELFEIAPLDQMVAEIEIAAADIAPVRAGAVVTMQLEAYPGRTMRSSLEVVRPRTTVIGARSVFVAECVLENDELELMPGMRGTSKVMIGRKSLLSIVLGRPWRYLMMKLDGF